MPWEELLKLHDSGESQAAPAREDVSQPDSLIRQAAALVGQPAPAEAGTEKKETGPVYCGDGYIRRSPVQEYRTAADFRRRRIRRLLGLLLVLVLAALLVLALLKTGLFKLK